MTRTLFPNSCLRTGACRPYLVARLSFQIGGERFLSTQHDNWLISRQRELSQNFWIGLVPFQPGGGVQCFVFHDAVGPSSEREPDASVDYPGRTDVSGEGNAE